MAISNKKKARESARTLIGDDRNIEPLVDLLMQAMEWKDEQHAKEKQQLLIEKACEWLKANADEWIASYSNIFIDNFKKAMEEL